MKLCTAVMVVFGVVLGLVVDCVAEDWTAFRGPRGDGTSLEDKVPTNWSTDQNIKWKVKLPRPGNGSPIVSKGHVLLACSADTEGRRRSLHCYDRETGAEEWIRTIDFDQEMPTHETNPYCGSTPVANDECIVVWHSSAGLFCYDYDGNVLWSRDLGEFKHMWGYGASPIIHDGKVIINCGPGKRAFVTAVDLKSGKTLWEEDEAFLGDGDRNADGKYMGSWSTPILAKVGGRDQVICAMATRIKAHDPTTGELIWSCDGVRGPKGDLAYSSPMISGDLCVFVGGFNGPAMAIKLGGTGNLTSTHRLWRNTENPQSIGTGVFVRDHIFRSNAGRPSIVDCMHAKTGEIAWTGPAGGSAWSSIVAAAANLYLTDQEGTTLVFKPNPSEFELVAKNKLDEHTNSTMAISNGEIFLRTFDHLWCVASE